MKIVRDVQFDNFEVHAIRRSDKRKNPGIWEQCNLKEGELFTVFGHHVGGGLRDIADYSSLALADAVCTLLKLSLTEWRKTWKADSI